MRPVVTFYLLPALLALALFGSARALHRQERGRALELWSLAMDAQTEDVAREYNDCFRSIYEGLRTIARLPSVRRLQRDGQIDADARQTAQEIYNNLAVRVAMSEVYVAPLDFDPDAIDHRTGRPQEPLTTFDELIVGHDADRDAAGGDQGHQPGEVADEIEIFEYRQMRTQLGRMRQICPDERAVAGLDYPALCSSEVVTCDNRFYSPSRPDDADRHGLVYSVPFFAPDGRLGGCISGVILTRVLRQLLPSGNYAFGSATHGYVAPALQPGVWEHCLEDIAAARPARDLQYSRLQPLRIADNGAAWALWVGRRADEFERSPYAQKADAIFYGVCSVSLALVLALAFTARMVSRQRLLDRERGSELEKARDAAVELARAKSSFVAIASHEIRTPMNGVLGMTELLLQGDLPPAQRELAETASQSAKTLVDLIQGILDYSRIDAGKLQLERVLFDPIAAIEDVGQLLAPVAAQQMLPLVVQQDEAMPRSVIGDPGRLRQVLTNLLGNAIKFTSTGRIVVTAESIGDTAAPRLRIAIIDTGIGLDPALKDRLFQPFAQADSSTTRRFGGSGLGLAISRGLIAAMGGTLDYEPTPGGGTTFCCTIPFDAAVAPAEPARPLVGRRVLLVDHDDAERTSVFQSLRLLGAEVEAHATVAAATSPAVADSAPITCALVAHAALDDGGRSLRHLLAARRPDLRVVALDRWCDAIGSPAALTGRAPTLRLPARLAQIARAVLATTEASPPRATVASALPLAGQAGRALIADDNEVNLRVACMMMKKLGYDCVEARDGEQAVHRFAAATFDVVLMDWQMPRLDGIEAARQIRAFERARGSVPVPIIAVTANAMPDDERCCLDAGMSAFLTKPISSVRLQRTLTELRADAAAATSPP